MHFGIHIFPTEYSIQPGELARQVEARGFDSVWFSEHTHIPADFLKAKTEDLADHYWQTYDPFVASALAATTTHTIQIGTGVSLLIQHDPIIMAKTVATLDHVSGGRFNFGVGAGWLAPEMANHGVNYSTRYQLIDEQMKAIKTIWANEEAEFHGNFVNFTPIKSHPKPLQKPHPPITAGGGTGPKSLAFVVDHCDGWMPILGIPAWDEIKAGIKNLHRRAQDGGRDPETIELSVFVWELPDEQMRTGMAEAGIRRIIVSLGSKSRDEALQQLDQLAHLNE